MAGKAKILAAEIDARLYEELVRVAKQTGRSERDIVEEALERYLQEVIRSQQLVRPSVMNAFEHSISRNRELLERLTR